MMRSLTWWLLTLALAGCHELLPFRAGERAASRDGDHPRLDAHLEGTLPDQPQDTCDWISTSLCVECKPPVGVSSCPSSIAPDGLDPARDPWPTVCNPLVFSEDFKDSAISRWATFYEPCVAPFARPCVRVPRCGVLQFGSPEQYTLRAWPHLGEVKNKKVGSLVEVAFKPPPLDQPWSFGVWADASAKDGYEPKYDQDTYRECKLLTASGQLELKAVIVVAGKAKAERTVPVTSAPTATSFRLQSWMSAGVLGCRLLDRDGGLLSLALTDPVTVTLPAPGKSTLVLTFEDASLKNPMDAWVDWVRVFDPP